MHHTKLGIYT